MKRSTDVITHTLDARDVRVWVAGDVHVGAEGFQASAFEAWLKQVVDDEDSYVVFLGDLMDNATRSSKGDPFSGMSPRAQMDYLQDALYPLAQDERILAFVAGNHELRTERECGIDPLYDVAVRLGLEDVYRRDFAAVRVRLAATKNLFYVYNFLAFHGASDGKVRAMANNIEGFDAILTGHSHQPVVRIPAHLVLTQKGTLVTKEVLQVTGCSWCDYTGYGARGMFQPQTQSRPQCMVLSHPVSMQQPKSLKLEW